MQSAPYRETVRPPLWVVLALYAIFGASLFLDLAFRGELADRAPRLVWVWDLVCLTPCVMCAAAYFLLGRLTISIENRVLQIQYGVFRTFGVIGKGIPLELIASAEAVEYQPLREFKGWGLRRGQFRDTPTAVYSLKGSAGVLLTLKVPIDTLFVRTHQILIGNQNPAQLADSVSQSIAA